MDPSIDTTMSFLLTERTEPYLLRYDKISINNDLRDRVRDYQFAFSPWIEYFGCATRFSLYTELNLRLVTS